MEFFVLYLYLYIYTFFVAKFLRNNFEIKIQLHFYKVLNVVRKLVKINLFQNAKKILHAYETPSIKYDIKKDEKQSIS